MKTDYSNRVIGAAIEVHRKCGPGLLESAYEFLLIDQLEQKGLRYDQQRPVLVTNSKGQKQKAYYIDLLIEETLVVELKAVRSLNELHVAQLYTYLKMSGYQYGLILNFNSILLKDGIKRVNLKPPGL